MYHSQINPANRLPHPYIMPGLRRSGNNHSNVVMTVMATLEPQQVIKKVAHAFNITTDEIMQRSRKQEIVVPRQIAQYILVNACKITMTKTGKYFMQDHATVLHSIRTVKARYETDKRYREMFMNIIYA